MLTSLLLCFSLSVTNPPPVPNEIKISSSKIAIDEDPVTGKPRRIGEDKDKDKDKDKGKGKDKGQQGMNQKSDVVVINEDPTTGKPIKKDKEGGKNKPKNS